MVLPDQTLTVQIRSLLNKIDNTYLPTKYRFAVILGKIDSVILAMLCDKKSQESRERIVSNLARCYVELDDWAQSLLSPTDDYTRIYDIDVYDEDYILRSYENASAIECLYAVTFKVSSSAYFATYRKRDHLVEYKKYTWPRDSILRDIRTAQILIVLIAAKIDSAE